MKKNHGKAWTTYEDKKLLYLYENGNTSHKEIAKILQRSVNAIESRLNKIFD